MSIVKKYVFVFASIILSVKSFAQAPTPFSTFGIGEPYGNATVNTQGMGGVGVSQPQFWFINNQNPALLVYNGLTSFQAGIITDSRTISSQTVSQKSSGGNMNYLITAFPILPPRRVGQTTRWTTSVGLMPLTSVKYKLAYQDTIADTAPVEMVNVTEEGSGGLTTLFWSNGVRITDDLSVGLRINYIFSSTITSYKNQLPATSSPVSYFTTIEEQTYVRDWGFTFAAAYSKDSIGSKNYRFSLGGTATLGSDLNATRTIQFFRASSVGENIEGDTLDQIKGSMHLPATVTIGASFSRGLRWSVGGEFTYQNWSTFTGFNAEDEGLEKSWRVALGGEWTPDPVTPENFFKRVTYRLGLNYEKTPFMAPFANPNPELSMTPQPVYDYGATFGLSVPTGRSSLDISFKYGQRGDKAKNLIEESYYKISFGITFNDTWFIKTKFD